jgi:hypothetical protein
MSNPTKEGIVAIQKCPRFSACNAPVCPLLPIPLVTSHQRGDSVCPYLLEAVKPGGEARLRCVLPERLVGAVVDALPAVIALSGDIARAIKRASAQGSRIEGAQRARAARALARDKGDGADSAMVGTSHSVRSEKEIVSGS